MCEKILIFYPTLLSSNQKVFSCLNFKPSHVIVSSSYSLKTLENLWCSDVFKGYINWTLTWNWLIIWPHVLACWPDCNLKQIHWERHRNCPLISRFNVFVDDLEQILKNLRQILLLISANLRELINFHYLWYQLIATIR